MDLLDRRLLDRLQDGFPLTEEPYRTLAGEFGTDAATILARVEALRGVLIRRIGAVYDSRRLGCVSTLVAVQTGGGEMLAAILETLPAVTHAYLRQGIPDFWFTLTCPDAATLQAILEQLRGQFPAWDFLRLDARRHFKIGVHLPMVGQARTVSASSRPPREPELPIPLDATDRRIGRLAQDELPRGPRPFAIWAQELGIDEDQLRERLHRLLARGVIRRFAALLHHEKAGYDNNVLAALRVKAENVESVAVDLASRSQISHLYERIPPPDLPCNLFAMIHLARGLDPQTTVQDFCAALPVEEIRIYPTLRSFIKRSPRYFS